MHAKNFILILLGFSLHSCIFSPLKSPKDIIHFQNTPVYELAVAVNDDDVEKIERIVKNQDIDIDYENKVWKMSVLEVAVVNKKYKAIDCLMKFGADPFLKEKRQTAFSLAAEIGDLKSLDIMFKYINVDSMPADVAGFSLYDAQNHEDAFNLLVEHNLQKKDTVGTSIYEAVYVMEYKYALKMLKLGVVFDDSVGIRYADELPGNTHLTISELLRTKGGINLDSTPKFIVDWRRKDLIDYLKEERGIDIYNK